MVKVLMGIGVEVTGRKGKVLLVLSLGFAFSMEKQFRVL
jgi:hypothetical protein